MLYYKEMMNYLGVNTAYIMIFPFKTIRTVKK